MSFILGVITGGLFVGACAWIVVDENKKLNQAELKTEVARIRREIVIDLIKKGKQANG